MNRIVAVVAMCSCLSTTAWSQESNADAGRRAQRLVNEASALFSDGEYEASLKALREAEALASEVDRSALPLIRFNIARCLQELGRYEEAIEAYQAYNKLPDASYRKQRAFKALQELEREVYGTLSVACDPVGATIEIRGVTEGTPSCPWKGERVPPGSYALKVTHPGYLEEVRLIEVVSGKAESVEIALERDPEALALLAPAPGFRLRPLPTSIIASGVGLVGLGIGFNILAANNRDDVESFPPGSPESEDALDSFDRNRAIAIAGYAAGGSAIIAGTILYILKERKDDKLSWIEPSPQGFAIRY
ncbi:MAG: PEGA domain-containing protein [Myxococcota bacterium]